ncbi:MAG: YIP1 family protein [Rubrobacteraceae bacterium]
MNRADRPGYYSREDFWGALRGVWLSPGRFFRELDPDGGFFRPGLFATLVLYLNLVLEAVLQAAWTREFEYALLYAPLLGLVVALVLGPLLVAGLAALALVVLDGAPSRARFGPAFRAVSYASGIGIVLWIPYGPFLALLYGSYAATVGLRWTLNLTWKKAAAAALIPLTALVLILLLLTGPVETYELFTNPPQS